MTRVKEVVSEIRIAVRGYVWSKTKFAKGEGSMSRGQLIGCKRIKLVPEFGNSHERPDFTKPSKGYQSLILDHCNYSRSAQKSSEERALFWKSYEDVVKSEVQVKRSSASRVRQLCSNVSFHRLLWLLSNKFLTYLLSSSSLNSVGTWGKQNVWLFL